MEGKSKVRVKDPDRLRAIELISWSGNGMSIAANTMILGFLQMFCTNILGLDPLMVGSVLLGTRIVDIFTDILLGYIVDRTNTRWGRGRPYTLCIIGTWAATFFLFACPPSLATTAKVIWIAAAYFIVNSGFNSMIAAAGTPYMVRAFKDKKYVSLLSYGGLLTMLGAVVVNIVFPQLLGGLATTSAGWKISILMFAVPFTVLGLWRFFAIKEKYNVDAKTEKPNFRDIFNVLKTNRHIYSIAVVMFLFNIVANMGAGTYYYMYVVGNVGLASIMGVLQIFMVPIMFVFPPLLKKVSIKDVFFWSLVMSALGRGVVWIANANVPILIAGEIITQIGTVPLSMFLALLIVDCADFNEWKGLHRMEATLSSIPNLTTSLGAAFGSFVLGLFLVAGQFVTSVDGAEVAQPGSVLLWIRLSMSIFPMVLYAISALLMRIYKLDKLMPQIREENAARREERLGTEKTIGTPS
jgi:Na+/melibiose symporter-like transporter